MLVDTLNVILVASPFWHFGILARSTVVQHTGGAVSINPYDVAGVRCFDSEENVVRGNNNTYENEVNICKYLASSLRVKFCTFFLHTNKSTCIKNFRNFYLLMCVYRSRLIT